MKAQRITFIFSALLMVLIDAHTVFSAELSHPSVPKDPLGRGLYLAGKGYPEEAAFEFRRCTNLPTATPLQLQIIAKAFLDSGDMQSALKTTDFAITQSAVKEDKQVLAALYNIRASVLVDQKRTREAIESYKLAVAANPEAAHTCYEGASEQLIKLKAYTKALPLLQKAILPGKMNGFIYQHIGECYLEMKNPSKSIDPLLASIKSFQDGRRNDPEAFLPGFIRTHKLLVRAYEETNNQKMVRLWQRRLDGLVFTLDRDFFGTTVK